jgi:hypothetical protein
MPAMLACVGTPRCHRARLAFIYLSGWLILACATPPPPGPPFVAAPEPDAGRARLYLFRVDPRPTLSTVEIAIDERREIQLRHGEYATFELEAGSHRLDFRQRGLAFASWGWNRQRIQPRSGETIYLEISVRLSAQPVPGSGRDLEIGGRESGAASENVFIQHRTEAAARQALAGTTLRVP